MKSAVFAVALSLASCAATKSTTLNMSGEAETPGGECAWSIAEGGTECVVEVSSESRTRSPNNTNVIEGKQGYGKTPWKCGEKRVICGTEVECTCPFPSRSG